MQSRRDFLKSAAMLTGAAGAAAGIPASVAKAFAIAPDPGTTWADAEHVVILMQENRSFDHALGTLQGVRGFNDPRAIRQANGNSIFHLPAADQHHRRHLRAVAPRHFKDTKITWMGSIPHGRPPQPGRCLEPRPSQCLDRRQAARQSRLHQRPHHHGPLHPRGPPVLLRARRRLHRVRPELLRRHASSTTPNRSVFFTGTVHRDEQNAHSSVYIRNPEYAGTKPASGRPFPERLTEAGDRLENLPERAGQSPTWTPTPTSPARQSRCNVDGVASAHTA